MPFKDIYGQEMTVTWLQRSILDNQVGHAYLFAGPEGIGKRTLALAYARALNCTDEEAQYTGDFCGHCRSCRMIELGQHPDVRLLTPETCGGKTVIPIDAIRTKVGESPSHPLPLREDAQLRPMEGRFKVYIIDPANRPGLQEDAGNALLLTLEEPPSYVVMILISSRPSAVLPTLVSRCRPVRLQLAPREVVEQALRIHGDISEEQIIAIAGMAAGRVGWALSVGTNPEALHTRHSLLEGVGKYYALGRRSALRAAEMLHTLATGVDLSADTTTDDAKARTTADRQVRRNLPELLDITASWWRDMLLVEMGQGDMIINLDFTADLKHNAGRHTTTELRQGLQTILKTKRLIERNVNIDLALESMWMNILPL